MIKKNILAVVGIMLASCATENKPVYFFNEILVVNNSREFIRDVSISAVDSGRQFSCTNIAPLGICSNKFPRRRYEYAPIRIDWSFAGKARQTDSFVVDVPLTFYTGQVLRGVLEIGPEGAVKAYFQQENPVK